jgi:hypothetical protein
MLVSQACCGSVGSGRSLGSSDQDSAEVDTDGASNSTELAEVSAVPVVLAATVSRSTPSIWVRSSSADANRSAGSGAQHFAISQYSESCSANSGVLSGGGSVER